MSRDPNRIELDRIRKRGAARNEARVSRRAKDG